MMNPEHKLQLLALAREDVGVLETKGAAYGDSWKRRGGVGAFMMLARKWDRIENVTRAFQWDVFEAGKSDGEADAEGVLDDIADLRRYLLLVECEVRRQLADPYALGALLDIQAKREAEREAEEAQTMREHAAAIRSQGQ
jgi:hypothetical protein